MKIIGGLLYVVVDIPPDRIFQKMVTKKPPKNAKKRAPAPQKYNRAPRHMEKRPHIRSKCAEMLFFGYFGPKFPKFLKIVFFKNLRWRAESTEKPKPFRWRPRPSGVTLWPQTVELSWRRTPTRVVHTPRGPAPLSNTPPTAFWPKNPKTGLFFMPHQPGKIPNGPFMPHQPGIEFKRPGFSATTGSALRAPPP